MRLTALKIAICTATLLSLWLLADAFARTGVTRPYDTDHSREAKNMRALRNAATFRAIVRTKRHTADCVLNILYCATDRDCDALCSGTKGLAFQCSDEQRCIPVQIHSSDADRTGAAKKGEMCDAARGEYALLLGHPSLGAVSWKCVSMYEKFNDPRYVCEGGTMTYDARISEPSYSNCSCSDETVRAIYNLASFSVDAISHCVPLSQWKFYANSMRRV